MKRNRWIAVEFAAIVTVALAACAGTGASSPSSTVAPTPGLAAATDVVGHNTCTLTAVPQTAQDTGGLKCTQVASDPRLSGEITATFRYVDLPSDNNVMWGSNTIAATGGSWACQFVGLRSPASYHAFDFECKGEDGYAGLWAYYHQDGDVNYSAISGWIEVRK